MSSFVVVQATSPTCRAGRSTPVSVPSGSDFSASSPWPSRVPARWTPNRPCRCTPPAGSGQGRIAPAQPDQLASAKSAAAQLLRRNKSLEMRINARLEGAGTQLNASEWLLIHVGITLVAGFLGTVIGGGRLLIGVMFLLGGVVLPWMWLGFKRSRRRKNFGNGLPDTLQLMAGSLTAGLSLAQSIDTIVNEGSEPISSEFRRVLVETRLGVSLETALEGVAERFDSKDFAWVVMAINIQRRVGGNLAELLETVAGTIREREYMRRQVAALAAEGKLSAFVLGGLPPLFFIYLLFTRYDYIATLFKEPLGWLMLGGSVLILGIGAFWMSRIIKVEV